MRRVVAVSRYASAVVPMNRPGFFARGYRAALDLVFPPRCAGCNRRGDWLCPACAARVRPLAPPWCARCGVPLRAAGGARCRGCAAGGGHALDWARAAYPFAGPLRGAIHRFKYEGERARAEHLGRLFAIPLDLPEPAGSLLIVPVPLGAARRRERGYNQAEELAKVLATARGDRLDTGLARVRATRPQVGLGAAERRANVCGAFAWQGASLAGQRVLLVDDVMTTGATAEACAVALKAAGASWAGILTVARAVGQDMRGSIAD